MELLQELVNNPQFQSAVAFLLKYVATEAFDSLPKLVARKKNTAEELLVSQLAECIGEATDAVCNEYHWKYNRKNIIKTLKTDQKLWNNLGCVDSLFRLLAKITGNSITNEIALSWVEKFQLQLACHQELYNYVFSKGRGTSLVECSYHTDNETYLSMFHKPMFLEDSVEDEYEARLKDVYIPPKYACKTPEGIKRIDIYGLLTDFFFRRDTFTLQRDDRFPIISRSIFAIMILGRPGSGKSSFVAYMANQLKESGRPFYIVRLRNMLEKQINDADPILGLTEYLQITLSDLSNAILVLDGLDEICALYSRTDFSVYLKKLLHNFHSISGLQVILTSRTGYFKTNNKGITDYCLEINIENWDCDDITCWSEKYAGIHHILSETVNNNKLHLLDEQYSDKRAIFAVPILFYMANVRNVYLEHCSSICEVYNSVLQEVAGDRGYDYGGGTSLQELISPYLARQICREIAFAMFRMGRLKMTDPSDPYLDPNEVNAAVADAMKIYGAGKSNLDEADKERIKKYYALTFYYNKNDSEQNAVEFAHKSIAEYFIAEKILELLTSDIPLCEAIAECFGYAALTNDIAMFIYEKIKGFRFEPAICALRNKLGQELLGSAIEGGLFVKPSKYGSTMHYLDRATVMLKSTLLLFEYLDCRTDSEHIPNTEAFNNIVAGISRLVAVNANHNILIPLCLNGFDLSDGDFSCGEFSEAHLSATKLVHTNFRDANMVDAQMHRCFIEAADFERANLAGADLTYLAMCNNTDFSQASLQGADLSGSIFINTAFDGTDMREAILDGCVFGEGCTFPDANLYGAQLSNADISKASIIDVRFDADAEDDEELDITQILRLRLTQEQHDYLSSFRCVELIDCIIV